MQLGPSIQWVQSFVTEDKITCIFIAPNAELGREHARLGEFPADHSLKILGVFGSARSITPLSWPKARRTNAGHQSRCSAATRY
jgi:hypothetical protein